MGKTRTCDLGPSSLTPTRGRGGGADRGTRARRGPVFPSIQHFPLELAEHLPLPKSLPLALDEGLVGRRVPKTTRGCGLDGLGAGASEGPRPCPHTQVSPGLFLREEGAILPLTFVAPELSTAPGFLAVPTYCFLKPDCPFGKAARGR